MDSTVSLSRYSALEHKRDNLKATSALPNTLSLVENNRLITLRGSAQDKKFLAAAKQHIGVSLPTKPCTAQDNGRVSALWMGPDNWLIIANETEEDPTLDSLKSGLTGHQCAVVDVSHSRAILLLTGPSSRAVLAKGCSLDFLSKSWKKGICANSLIANCDVTLWQKSAAQETYILVHNSFADYVTNFILDAMLEFNRA